MPKVAGWLVWARSLFVSVKEPHNTIADLVDKSPEYNRSDVVKRASELYTKLKTALRTFETERFLGWKSNADSIITTSLGSPLLGEKLTLTIDDLRSEKQKQ